MSRLHPDLRSTLDHEVEQLRSHDFVRKVPAAGNGRGGGGRSGGRGGRGGENVRCCYGCGEPGHFVRDCPVSGSHPRGHRRRGSQAYGNGDPSKVDVIEASCGDGEIRTKSVIMPKEFQTVSEPAKPFSDELALKNIEINSLLSKVDQKEKELDLYFQENKGLKSQLKEAISEISSIRAEKEGMSLKISQLEEELEKYKKNLSSAKDKEVEMTWKWSFLKDEFEDTKAQLKEVKEANEAVEADMKKLKLEMEQWRKAAKAAAAVFVGCADVCSKAAELESLVLYYNNRAVKRISLGKIGKALDDCKMAARLDTDFLKVCLTAGHCHLVLGEVDDAMYNYNKCLESGMVCLDRRLRIEASDGLQKAQKVLNCINQSAELLQQKTIDAASTAMEAIVEALSISCHSEKLLEMKGEALFMLQKYEEVIQMCEQTLDFAEKNVSTFGVASHASDADGKRSLKRWRWNLMSRSYFYLGRLDTALAIIEKQEPLKPTEDKIEGSPSSLAFTIRELLRCKSDGNEAYKSGRHREALKHYSHALSCSIESRPFTAVCLCNRAAAHQALGEVIDAIADCNLAIALDGSYLKAISRRANLHEKIRDYEHAAHDLQRLISLLEKRSGEKSLQSNTADVEDIRSARRRLSSTENKAKKGMPLDLYLILGLKGSDSASEIKKAYHKAALRHHPDKAGKFLARSESRDGGQVWKDIVTTIQKDSDRLFKIIGEAYAVLSDANKRFKYNLEDSMWDD